MNEKSGLPTSKAARLFKLGSLSSVVSASYLGQKVKGLFTAPADMADSLRRAHVRNAERMAKTFGELKGAVMKVGQMASLQFDFLPPEMAAILSRLQKDAPPVEFPALDKVLQTELSAGQRTLIRHIDPVPYASASIGQVHRAQLTDGRQIALKIQYPGVDSMVDSDLATLRRVFGIMAKFFPEVNIDPFFDEIRDRLREELDYQNEANNMNEFRGGFADDPRIIIPNVVPQLSTTRILATELVEGGHLRDLEATATDQDVRNAIGETIVSSFLRQFCAFRTVQVDPNLSNFAYRPPNTLIMYDFGCVKRFPPRFVLGYLLLTRHILRGELSRVSRACQVIGITQAGGGPLNAELFTQFCIKALEPFLSDKVFDFRSMDVVSEVVQMGAKNYPETMGFVVPQDEVFFHRVLGGMFVNLRSIHARVNVHRLLTPYLADISYPEEITAQAI